MDCLGSSKWRRSLYQGSKNGAQICIDFAKELDAEGLKTSVTVTHDLGSPDWIIAFGGDDTIQTLHERYPSTPIQKLWPPLQFAVVDALHCDVQALARSVLAYDTRGCMAPVACFVLNHTSDFDRLLINALHEDTLRYPEGVSEPYLGPELRRRQGLARIYGSQHKGAGFEVLNLPHRSFFPSALPRTAVVHPIEDLNTLTSVIEPWQNQISSIGWDLNDPCPFQDCRVVAVADIQRPRFPRRHDGEEMWCQA